MKRILLSIALIATSVVGLSCNVNDYCLNCAKNDGGDGDGMNGDGGDDGGGDGIDAPLCAAPAPEVCNNKDDDCDGNVDEGTLPQVGDLCQNQVGECSGGTLACMNGAIKCTKPPMAESCNNKDDDCDGTIDDGDPGGGVLCGTDTGECVAGVMHCVVGVPTCQGAVGPSTESCDGKDNNCDGMIDNGAPADPTVCNGNSNVGECNMGTAMCIGGNSVCIGAQGPTVELCDNKDQDCDGNVNTIDPNTNGFNLQTDPTNCGTCGHVCNLAHAVEGCAAGQCTILACDSGYHNNDGMVMNGCEFGPCTIQGNEVCNGMDDDCDGLVDGLDPQMQTPPVATMCETQGECAGASVVCDAANGFKCVYPDPDVSQMNGVIQPETLCDGKDNDCDGAIDEGQPGIGTSCSRGQGECSTTGMFVCDSGNLNGPAVCNAPNPGAGTPETCDGKDNDCNGVIDDNAATGNLPGQEWIAIPGSTAQMMKYEASHPDATTSTTGALTGHACSRPNALPWTNITYPQAVAACSSIGARLCTEAEWQSACLPDTTYPVDASTLTTSTSDFVFIEAENAQTNATVGGRTWTAVSPASLDGVTAMQVPDTGFLQNSATNAVATSARLDYQLKLAGSTNYRVWMRMRSPVVALPTLGTSTAATQTLAPSSAATTAVGDLVIVTTFTSVTNNNNITHTTQTGFTQISSVQVTESNANARMSIAYKVATVAGAQTYQAYTASTGTSWSGIAVVRAGTYDIANITGIMSTNTGNQAPNPPQALNPLTSPSLVLAVGGWNLSPAANVNAGPPNNFTELWEMSGSLLAELSVATGNAAAGAQPDPGGFSDNVTPLNTIAATITVGAPGGSSRSAWVALNPGTTPATNANATFVTTSVDDQWSWFVTPTLTSSGAGGTHTFSIYVREDGLMIDTIAISQQATTSPTIENVWAYETNPRTAQPAVCNGDEVDTAPPVPIAAAPMGATAVGTTATFTTTAPHRLSVGTPVSIVGVANAAYNGTWTVASLISTTQFTATITTSGPAASGGGSANGDQDDLWASGTGTTCHAEHGANDVFDMSGNAKEWTLARVAGQNPLRGGSANNSVTGLTCKLNFTLADNTFFFPNVGFRCCR